MTPQQFRGARQTLGLTINQLAEILDTNPVTIRRWEMSPDRSTARDPNPVACQVLRWLASGQLKLGKSPMQHFVLCPVEGVVTDNLWVLARSETEARKMVASNADPDASDPEKFECFPDATYSLPWGVILTGGGETITVK